MKTRRSALQLLCASSGAALFSGTSNAAAETGSFRIGACDWSIGQKQNPAAFDVAREIGLEGVQVSFSDPGADFDLRDAEVRRLYYRKVEESGVKIASLGMGILNQMPLATHPESIQWVGDVVDVMAAMQKEQPDKAPKICLLAFFGKGDINGRPELIDAVIKKLKTVVTKAEEHGVILGIESLLSAEDHARIIDGVGSKNIQVYYDSANSDRMGYNIYEELIRIGGERICQVHCKENGELLGHGVIDFPRFKKSLDAAGYGDWLIIEGAMPKGADVVDAYQKNFRTLHQIFRSNA